MSARDRDSSQAILLMGPTGVGKSALALALAREFPLEIVSVDSAMVYRGMDIGTAKPGPEERAAVPHHLIDVCDPSEAYSAGRFQQDALALIGEIRGRGRIPLLVGGTMLYFRAIMHGLAKLPPADRELRARLDASARQVGWPALHEELARRDPESAARIRPTDAQRIQRALEVFELTGAPLSELQRRATGTSLRFRAWVLMPCSREELYRRLDRRLDAMIDAGLLAEARSLRDRADLGPELPSMRAVGYRQLWAHLDGSLSLPDAVKAAKRATRNLAKRQLTWLRSESALMWITGLEDQQLAPIKSVLGDAVPGRPSRGLC
jgi:tRNA dimethylallyltransferase